MAKVQQIYKQLQRTEDVTVDRAMTAALPTADRFALRLIALMLLKRKHPDGLLGLVLHHHLLPSDIQHTVANHAGELFTPLRKAAGMGHTHGPLNAIQIIHRSLSARLAYLASDQLRHGSSEAQGASGACLLHLARHAASDPRPGVLPQIEPKGIEYLQTALDEAVQCFGRHEQRSALVAAVWLAMRGSGALRQTLGQEKDPATRAMAALMEEAEQPAVLRSLAVLMSVPTVREAGRRGLRRAGERGRLGPMLAHFHMLRLPEVAAAMGEMDADTLGAVGVDEATARSMPAHELRGLPAWVMALPMEHGEKVRQLAQLRHVPDPATRLMALRRLMAISERGRRAREDASVGGDDGEKGGEAGERTAEEVLEAVAGFCDDVDAPIARIALRHLVRRQYVGLTRLLMRLVNSPHEAIQQYATRQLAPIGFQRLWEVWPRLDEQLRGAAIRALAKLDDSLSRHLGEKLRSDEQAAKLRALNMVAEMNMGGAFEGELRELSESPNEKVASAAVKALGSAGTRAAMASVEKAMEHTDDRVRANAAEAMSQLRSTQHVEQLAQMADEESNRPRASAIGALMAMKAGEALPALTRMLEDDRPEHRISALWLVEHMGVMEAAQAVAALATSDPDPEVRRRAEHVAAEVLAMMRAGDARLARGEGVKAV